MNNFIKVDGIMEKLQLIKTIDALSRVVTISEEQNQELINKYYGITIFCCI